MSVRARTYLPHRTKTIAMREILTFPKLIRFTAITIGLVMLLYFNYAQAAEIKGEAILMAI